MLGRMDGSAAIESGVLDKASLSEEERRVLVRFVALLREELGERLRAVWLYGSRARGERPRPYSDVDLIVLADGGRERWSPRAYDLLYEAAGAEGGNPAAFSVAVHDLDWLRGRREIRSFFIREVDRDKLVLHGSEL